MNTLVIALFVAKLVLITLACIAPLLVPTDVVVPIQIRLFCALIVSCLLEIPILTPIQSYPIWMKLGATISHMALMVGQLIIAFALAFTASHFLIRIANGVFSFLSSRI